MDVMFVFCWMLTFSNTRNRLFGGLDYGAILWKNTFLFKCGQTNLLNLLKTSEGFCFQSG